MGFSQDNGYIPTSVETIMGVIRQGINAQFQTNYTAENFVGSNHYKYFYALAQKLQSGEIKTSEIFLKYQQYIAVMNERISRPVNTTPGLIDAIESLGYRASLKPMSLEDRGITNLCVEVNDGIHAKGSITITVFGDLISGTPDTFTIGSTTFTAQGSAAEPGDPTFQAATSNAATAESLAEQINAHATARTEVRATAFGDEVRVQALHGGLDGDTLAFTYQDNDSNPGATITGEGFLEGGEDNEDYPQIRRTICEKLLASGVGGIWTEGSEAETIVISNGQAMPAKFHLPNRIPIGLQLTLTVSENNQVLIGDPDETRMKLFNNVMARYRLGKNFEPQKYFSTADAPWTSQVLLEWTTDITDSGTIADDASWDPSIIDADFDQLFEVDLGRIRLLEV